MSAESRSIVEGSPAWERLRNGIPREIADPHVRQMFHDNAQLVTIMIGEIDRLRDENERMHVRINRRREDHEALKDKLFDPETGAFAKLKVYVDSKFGKFTGPLFVLIGSVMSGLILLAANRLTGKGG